jgi:hypothetical protein
MRAAIALVLAFTGSAVFGAVQPGALSLVDSAGIVVGRVLDFPAGLASVPLLVEGHQTVLVFQPGTTQLPTIQTQNNASGPMFGGVFFASTDCTGQAFALNQGSEFVYLEPSAVAGPNYTYYAGTPSASPSTFNYNSALRGGRTCATESGSLGFVLPVFAVRDLTPNWQPPFHAQVALAPVAAVPAPAISAIGLLVLALVLGGAGIVFLRTRAAV